MNEDLSINTIFPKSHNGAYEDYLRFLAQRVPHDIRKQLSIDSQPDLGLNKSVTITDLLSPLSTFVFPITELREKADILGYTISCYVHSLKEAKEDPFKLIYVVSLYLYCFVRGRGPEASGYLAALAILTDVATRMDWETRHQVCRFLGALVPTILADAAIEGSLADEPAPAASALVAFAVILGSIVSDSSLETESVANKEKLGEAWCNEKAMKANTNDWGIRLLEQRVSELYGMTGKVRRAADRFVHIIAAASDQP